MNFLNRTCSQFFLSLCTVSKTSVAGEETQGALGKEEYNQIYTMYKRKKKKHDDRLKKTTQQKQRENLYSLSYS